MSVTDNTERFSSDFPTSLGNLVPDTGTHLGGSIDVLTREGNDFGNDEFGNRTRVGKGRVKDGNTVLSGGQEVDLVGSDTKASNDEELSLALSFMVFRRAYIWASLDDFFGNLGFASDTNSIVSRQLGNELLLGVGFRKQVDLSSVVA